MDYWQSVDHMADFASIYGVAQRRFIIATQQQAIAEQRCLTDLQRKHLRLEEARLDADERARQEQRDKADRQKQARKLFCLLDQQLSLSEQDFSGMSEDVVSLALVKVHLGALRNTDAFESLEDLRALSHLEQNLGRFVTAMMSKGKLSKDPSEIVLNYLPTLNAILSRSVDLLKERLFIHPKYQAALRKDEANLQKTIAALDFDAERWDEQWKANEKLLARYGIDTSTNKSFLATLESAGNQASQKLNYNGAIDKLFTPVDERTRLIHELESLRERARGIDVTQEQLIKEYTVISRFSQCGDARKELFRTDILACLDIDQVYESHESVRQMSTSLDEELQRLQQTVPEFCLSSTTRALNKEFVSIARIIANENSREDLTYVTDGEVYDFLFQRGEAYVGLKAELSDIELFLASLGSEYEEQCAILNQVNEAMNDGNVFTAQKSMKDLTRNFRIDYVAFDSALEQVMQPYFKARQLLDEARKYSKLKKNLVGQFFARGQKAQELLARIAVLRQDIVQLPACELQSEVTKALDSAEGALGGLSG